MGTHTVLGKWLFHFVLFCSELGGDCEHLRARGFMPPFLSFVGGSLGQSFFGSLGHLATFF